jgi:hypothetical protein
VIELKGNPMHLDLTVHPKDDSPIDLAKISKITVAPRLLFFVFLAGMVIGAFVVFAGFIAGRY